MGIILVIILSYLIGSISPSWFFGKLKGIDLRKAGSRNVGGLNAIKQIGFIPGVIAAILDIAKGVLIFYIAFVSTSSMLLMYLVGLAGFLGHIFPFYLNFMGGKGQAVGYGLIIGTLLWLGLAGWPLLVAFFLTKCFFKKSVDYIRGYKSIKKRKR